MKLKRRPTQRSAPLRSAPLSSDFIHFPFAHFRFLYIFVVLVAFCVAVALAFPVDSRPESGSGREGRNSRVWRCTKYRTAFRI